MNPLEKVTGVVNKKNVYVISSLLLVALIIGAGLMMYKNQLVNKLSERTYESMKRISPESVAGFDFIDIASLKGSMRSYWKQFSITKLYRFSKYSDSEWDAMMKPGVDEAKSGKV
jgi:hypothetical protein